MSSSKGTAFVTGGARGLGREIAIRLATDGFDVAINDLPGTEELSDVAKEIESKGRKSHVVVGDVSVEQDVIDMIKSVVDALGGLDVMVANAGILILQKFLESESPVTRAHDSWESTHFAPAATVEAFDRTLAVNARGVMLCYKHAGKQMIAQGRGGRIIGASSLGGKKGFSSLLSYSASKFAVRGLTQCAADELGKYGITVNAYCPGGIQTRLTKVVDDFNSETGPSGNGDVLKSLVTQNPMGRAGVPEDVAGLVSFLASKDSSFITGKRHLPPFWMC
ncbi:NAD(P)-binding protein [Artomyces pyxidatus]|uniref:NAD(P)-binding protein n=1 Tax=Artomyces pyxidatus TaxID=48021 RepID=A0ACB8TF55_9AGAM|nr:NAD(P)-binding protein [Artomyces pyxidatus]